MFSFCFDLLTDLDEYPHLTDFDTYTSSWAQELGDNDAETSPAEDQEVYATGESFWSKIINRFMKIVGGDLSANKNVNVDYGYEDDSYENEEEEEDDATVDEDGEKEEQDEYGGVDNEHGENLEEEYNEEEDNYNENYHENEEYEEQEEEEKGDHGIEDEEEYNEEDNYNEYYHENEENEEHEEEEKGNHGIEDEEEYNEEDNYNEYYHENEENEEHEEEEEDHHGIEDEEEYNEEDNYNENYHENEEYEEQEEEEEEEDDHGIEDDGSETPDGLMIEEDHLKSKEEDSDKDDIASDTVTNAVKGRSFEESYYLHHPYTDVSLVSDRIPVPRPKLNKGMADGFQGERSGAQQGTKDELGDYGENGRPAMGSEYAIDSQTDNGDTPPGSLENEFEGTDKEFSMNEAVYTSSHGKKFGIAKDFNSRYEEGSEQSERVESVDDDGTEGSNEENVDDELFTNYSGDNLESYVLADAEKKESTIHGSRPKRNNGNFINVLNNYVSLNALG